MCLIEKESCGKESISGYLTRNFWDKLVNVAFLLGSKKCTKPNLTLVFKVIGINQVESLWMTICWMFSSHALSPSDNRWKSVVENVFPLSFIFPPKHQRKQNKSCSLLHLSNIINLYSQHITRWFNQIHSSVRMVNLFICFFHMSCGVEI